MTDVIFDADNHFYEATDAFTRHLPQDWGERTVSEIVVNGRVRHLVGGKIETTCKNPTLDPIVRPGALMEFFRGNPRGLDQIEYLRDCEPMPAHYRDRDARLATMDEQGLEAIWILPSLGMAYEESMQHDPEAAMVSYRAYNRWMSEDWGFDYQHRIYAAPYLPMGRPDLAAAELDWMIDNGARIVVVRASGIWTDGAGWRAPSDPVFDPIWARLAEAGVVLAVHVGETGSNGLDRYEKHQQDIIGGDSSPLEIAVGHDRPIGNYLGALVCGRVFERFPTLKVASLENGSDFLPLLLAGLRRAAAQRPRYFTDDPVDSFKAHVWVAPFWEDSLEDVVEQIGADRVLFGSDWPHAEGLKNPRDYETEVEFLAVSDQRKILYENAAGLCGHLAPS